MNRQSSVRKKTTSEIICQNFKLQPQTIFQDYKCTLKANVTFFGRLYIGQQHLLFISNMFGIIKKCIIETQKVFKVQSLNQNGNSIHIIQKSEQNKEIQFFFGGFKNNNAFKLIRALWKRQKIASQFLKEDQENGEHDQQFMNTLSKQVKQATYLNSELKAQQGRVEANFFNPETVQNQKMKIVQVTIPCSVEQFYDYFIDDKATMYPKKKHFQIKKAQKITCTQWKQNKQLKSFIRQISAIIKVNGVPFKSTAPMNQVWQLKKDDNIKQKGFQFNVVTQMADIPYASYFNCQQHVKVIPLGPLKCSMLATVSIVFNKSTYMKGTILKRTCGDMKQDYQLWIKNVNDILIKSRKKDESEINLGLQKSRSDSLDSRIQFESNVPVGQISPMKIKSNSKYDDNNEIRELRRKLNFLVYLIGILILLNLLHIIISLSK